MNARNPNYEKSLGQYMTPKFIAEFMVSLIDKPLSASILEPGAGEGVFLEVLFERNFKNVTAYEIDERLGKRSPIKINYCDFLKMRPKPIYDVVIGNPPYVRWKNIPDEWRRMFRENHYWNKIMNGLCDLTYAYIYHAVNFLKDKGELIFICPLFWMETVHGKRLREYLSKNGSLELLINFNEAKIFNEVSSTIIVFKYVKGVKIPFIKVIEYYSKQPVTPDLMRKIDLMIKVLQTKHPDFYIEEMNCRAYLYRQFNKNEIWRPIPPTEKWIEEMETISDFVYVGDIAEIGNGMVSGLDEAFKLTEKELNILNEYERKFIIYVYKANSLERFFPSNNPTPYIFVNDIESEDNLKQLCPYFYEKLSAYKGELKIRYNYGRNIPWWHWVFLRNKNLFERYRIKIFVPSKERYDTKGYFRFALIKDEGTKHYYATQDVTAICIKKEYEEEIEYILGLLNSEPLQKWIIYRGFSRGGVFDFSENPLKIIPILRVNKNNPKEVESHRLIVNVVKEILSKRDLSKIVELNEYVRKLLEIKRKASTLISFIMKDNSSLFL
ncbi:MAG: N-6 DNA methylase [Candidatus Aenigmatarchaeota archaeon]